MKPITTCKTGINAEDPKIIGDEVYPIIGNYTTPDKIAAIWERCRGMRRHWNCLEKAIMAQQIFPEGIVVVGKCMVWSSDRKSQYGHYFRPPFEFHAWLAISNNIIDISLPGVIEKGLVTCDDYGPALIGVTPAILAGQSPDWIEYNAKEIY